MEHWEEYTNEQINDELLAFLKYKFSSHRDKSIEFKFAHLLWVGGDRADLGNFIQPPRDRERSTRERDIGGDYNPRS